MSMKLLEIGCPQLLSWECPAKECQQLLPDRFVSAPRPLSQFAAVEHLLLVVEELIHQFGLLKTAFFRSGFTTCKQIAFNPQPLVERLLRSAREVMQLTVDSLAPATITTRA